ncbi:MAG: bifunctional phosphopantothenoylcysteine decarboxylase/phosphopantothenate--cysteine ligase CoaBC [Candidatus Diapherotrites archaeon]
MGINFMHPSLKITGSKSNSLKGKHIVIALTGSVAVYKAIDLIRELMRYGAEIDCIMSKSACELISPELIHFASGKKPLLYVSGEIEHVQLVGKGGNADLFLICPATASSISKLAQGIGDEIVSLFGLTALGSKKKILIVPAMHEAMNENPFVKENIEKLKKEGIQFVEPKIEDSKAKFPEFKEIILEIKKSFALQKLNGKKFLVINGPSQEQIDSVRVITNNSSGKTGNLIAEELFIRGAKVSMVSSKEKPFSNPEFEFIEAKTFQEFFDKTMNALNEAKKTNSFFDAVIVPAALSDFFIKENSKTKKTKFPSNKKISSREKFSLNLIPNKKLIQEIRENYSNLFICSFKAETGKNENELIELGKKIIKEKKMDLIVLNDSNAFGSNENSVLIVSRKKSVKAKGKKELIAEKIVGEITRIL